MSQRQDASSGGVRRKVLMTCYFTPAQERALRTLTARTSVPMATYVRRGLERILAEHGLATETETEADPCTP